MTIYAHKAPTNFYDAAMAAPEPKGEYATAHEMLDDLPATVMHNYGWHAHGDAHKRQVTLRGDRVRRLAIRGVEIRERLAVQTIRPWS